MTPTTKSADQQAAQLYARAIRARDAYIAAQVMDAHRRDHEERLRIQRGH